MHRSRIRLTRARGVVGKPQPAPARVAFATVDRQRFQSLGPWRGSPAMRRVRQRAEQTARTCRARKAMQRRCVEAGRWQRFDVAWPLARLAGKAASAAEGRSNRENRGARNPMQRGCADRPASPSDPLRQFRYHPPGGLWASANRRSFSRPTSAVVLELGLEGKFAAKSTGWDEKPGSPRRGPVGDRSQGRPLGADAPPRQAGGAEASPSLLPGRLSCGAAGAETPLRCAVTSRCRVRQRRR